MTTRRKGWHLAPTGRQIAQLQIMSAELGITMPQPINRDEARRLLRGYKTEKEKRGLL